MGSDTEELAEHPTMPGPVDSATRFEAEELEVSLGALGSWAVVTARAKTSSRGISPSWDTSAYDANRRGAHRPAKVIEALPVNSGPGSRRCQGSYQQRPALLPLPLNA